MGKSDITIDVANCDKVLEIIRHAYESAEKFVKKVDSGKARSTETYADMKKLMNLIEGVNQEVSKYEIKVVGKDVHVDVVANAEEMLIFLMKNIDAIKGIIQTITNKNEEVYNATIEECINNLKKPLRGKMEKM